MNYKTMLKYLKEYYDHLVSTGAIVIPYSEFIKSFDIEKNGDDLHDFVQVRLAEEKDKYASIPKPKKYKTPSRKKPQPVALSKKEILRQKYLRQLAKSPTAAVIGDTSSRIKCVGFGVGDNDYLMNGKEQL